MSSRNDIETQVTLWGIVTHEVATFASSSVERRPSTTASEYAQDDALLRELQAMVNEARREEPVRARTNARAGTAPLTSEASRRRVTELVWSLRQLISGDRDLVALVGAYERGTEGAAAAAAAGLSRDAYRAALRRLKVVCDQLDLFGQARPTRH